LILANGPRPFTIHAACALVLIVACTSLIGDLSDLASSQIALSSTWPSIGWNRDWTIVALGAEFTIALIPIVWIILVARPFARWMVSAFGVWKLWWLVGGGIGEWVEAGLIALSIALLFTPTANRYFARP
jgi:hypothetical protein